MSAIARLAGMLVLLLAAVAAAAQTKVPSERPLEALVKSALLSFNDANLTGNYTVFHAKLSKPFRQQFTVEKLKDTFREFNEKSIDNALLRIRSKAAGLKKEKSELPLFMARGKANRRRGRK